MPGEKTQYPRKWKMPHGKTLTLKEGETVKEKTEGAKNAGKYTGFYNFSDETMLVKQGNSMGETIAEYLGGNLYQLVIPDYAAKAYLIRPEISENEIPKKEDVYVTSVFIKNEEGNTTAAFKFLGYKERPGLLDHFQDKIKKFFHWKEEGIFRKLILDDQNAANSTLGYSIANALWHGDQDIHTGNLMRVESSNDLKKNKYIKIDHGFSFFNLRPEVTNIFDPFVGKRMTFNLKKALRGEGLVEFYPPNNFWNLAAEKKNFYYSGGFIKACDEICKIKESEIRENIKKSLLDVKEMYNNDTKDALQQFGKRIGMKSNELKNNNDPDALIDLITNHMTQQLVARQHSLLSFSNFCRNKAKKLTEQHHKISRHLDEYIIALEVKTGKFPDHEKLIHDEKIIFYKILSQANDLNYLALDDQKNIKLKTNFYFYNNGHTEEITPANFQQKLEKMKKIDPYPLKIVQDFMQSLTLPVKRRDFLSKVKKVSVTQQPSQQSSANEKENRQSNTMHSKR